jgi:hypothetical protein
MLTAGYTIVDPVFRKIVNLTGPTSINVVVAFSYNGSKPGRDPCTTPQQNTIAGFTKTVSISPNRQAVNPCPAAKGSYIAIGSNKEITIKFSDAVYGSTILIIDYKRLTDTGWEQAYSTGAELTAIGQTEFELGTIPFTGLEQGTYKMSVVYFAVPVGSVGLVTKCKAFNATADEVDIPVAGFELGASFTI